MKTAEEWIKSKLSKQYIKDCHVNPYDLPKILEEYASSQPPAMSEEIRDQIIWDLVKPRMDKYKDHESILVEITDVMLYMSKAIKEAIKQLSPAKPNIGGED
jgi:hypothetical protein